LNNNIHKQQTSNGTVCSHHGRDTKRLEYETPEYEKPLVRNAQGTKRLRYGTPGIRKG